VGARFGAGDRGLLDDALADLGIAVTTRYPQRTSIAVRATAGVVNEVFDVELHDFVDPAGRRFRAPTTPPEIPLGLRDQVEGVAGLSSLPKFPMQSGTSPYAPILFPPDVAQVYGFDELWDADVRGQGMTIATINFATFVDGDVQRFDDVTRTVGAPKPLRVNPVPGHVPTPGADDVEPSLDVQTIRAVAPMAQILDFEGSKDLTFGAMVAAVVADGRADIVSISWGGCDALRTDSGVVVASDERAGDEVEMAAAEAAGVTIFVSSGDSGAYECQRHDPLDLRPTVAYPGSSPHVVSVGGTRLTRAADGAYLEEAGWEDVLSGAGGGGGLSVHDPRPSWQVGPGVDNDLSTGQRQVPDVAGPADSDVGFLFFYGGDGYAGGGTSQAAPFWAASLLLVQQYAQTQGIDSLGRVNPLLYGIAADPSNGAFHDVVKGGDRLHDAGPGWDYATGWGSPDVGALARAVVAELGG
jgi:kumamolisin